MAPYTTYYIKRHSFSYKQAVDSLLYANHVEWMRLLDQNRYDHQNRALFVFIGKS